MYIVEEKIYGWLLLSIPVLWTMYWLLRWWQKKTQSKFARPELLERLTPDKSPLKSMLKLLLLSISIIFISIALMNPKMGTKLETLKREGVDIVFALDVSKSMLAEDISPNRLDKSKQIINQLINNLSGDRVGLIGYAGSAFPQVPITTDYAAAKTFLRSMNTAMVSSQGTATRDAVNLAKRYFDDEQKISRVLVLVSDGEDHEADFELAVEEAYEEGIIVFTIGVGTEKGAPIPIKRNGVVQSYKKDNTGETVITKADVKTLKTIAKLGGGVYVDGANTSEAVQAILESLNKLEKTAFESKEYANFQHHFQWFLAFGILLLILDVFLLERKTKWLSKFNLFNEEKK